MAQPEQILWVLARRKRQQFHFRRQRASGPSILDLGGAAAKLCVEVDGPVDAWQLLMTKSAYAGWRSRASQSSGFPQRRSGRDRLW